MKKRLFVLTVMLSVESIQCFAQSSSDTLSVSKTKERVSEVKKQGCHLGIK